VDLKQIIQFITEDKQRLSSQLSALEGNVVKETADIRSSYAPNLSQVQIAATTLAPVLTWQVGMVDMTTGNVSVTLAPDSAGQPGWVMLVKKQAANTLTIFPSGSNFSGARMVNGAASYALAGIGCVLFWFDGMNWYRN